MLRRVRPFRRLQFTIPALKNSVAYIIHRTINAILSYDMRGFALRLALGRIKELFSKNAGKTWCKLTAKIMGKR